MVLRCISDADHAVSPSRVLEEFDAPLLGKKRLAATLTRAVTALKTATEVVANTTTNESDGIPARYPATVMVPPAATADRRAANAATAKKMTLAITPSP
jgi:hypothetical protein